MARPCLRPPRHHRAIMASARSWSPRATSRKTSRTRRSQSPRRPTNSLKQPTSPMSARSARWCRTCRRFRATPSRLARPGYRCAASSRALRPASRFRPRSRSTPTTSITRPRPVPNWTSPMSTGSRSIAARRARFRAMPRSPARSSSTPWTPRATARAISAWLTARAITWKRQAPWTSGFRRPCPCVRSAITKRRRASATSSTSPA